MNQLEALVLEHAREWGVPDLGSRPRIVLVTPAYDTSRHVVALVFGDGSPAPRVVLKVARRPGDDGGLRREARVLRRLQELRGAGDDVPRVLDLLPFAGTTALVETALPGPPLGPERVRAHRDAALHAGVELVERLPVTGGHAMGWYDELVAAPVQRLLTDFPAIGADDLAARTHAALAGLRDTELPAVLEHGDLSHPNLLCVAPSRLGAVDWERSVEQGLVGHDLVYLVAYVAEAVTGAATMPERLASFTRALLDPEGWGRPLLAAHLDRRGVAVELLDPLLLVCVVRAAATVAERLLGEGDAGPQARAEAGALAARDRDVVLWPHVLASLEVGR